MKIVRVGMLNILGMVPLLRKQQLEPKASSCDDDQASGGKGQCY